MADQLQLESGVVLDARGAAWFGEAGILALAGVQIGGPGTTRPGGSSLALSALDDALYRFTELLADYRPLKTVVLGNPLPGVLNPALLEHALKSFVAAVACHGELVIVPGAPEPRLDEARQRWGLSFQVLPALEAGRLLLVHGDDASAEAARDWLAGHPGGLVGFDREHPVVLVRQQVPSPMRCPCFLVAPDRVCLPAYTPGVGGSQVGEGRFQSPLAREAAWNRVVAIAGLRLVSLPWPQASC
jgi:metallophosphoesterase superfamily enzyme